MTSSLRPLREKLCRELAQAEQSAAVHCERESRRYGEHPPAAALRAISRHAVALRPELSFLLELSRPIGARLGRSVGEALSALRHLAIDRIVDAERSYRATLLGVRHGIDVARLLHAVFAQQQDTRSLRACELLIEPRVRLIGDAERVLGWFARNPDLALCSSTTLEPTIQRTRQVRAGTAGLAAARRTIVHDRDASARACERVCELRPEIPAPTTHTSGWCRGGTGEA